MPKRNQGRHRTTHQLFILNMEAREQLTQLIGEAILSTHERRKTELRGSEFHIDYSGHIDFLSIAYYPNGFRDKQNQVEMCHIKLTDDEIQEAIEFLKNRLNKKL